MAPVSHQFYLGELKDEAVRRSIRMEMGEKKEVENKCGRALPRSHVHPPSSHQEGICSPTTAPSLIGRRMNY